MKDNVIKKLSEGIKKLVLELFTFYINLINKYLYHFNFI